MSTQDKGIPLLSPSRVSWDDYFLNLAAEVATRATCTRKRVGCVIVRDKSIVSTGYNGSVRGQPHCLEVGCLMSGGHCIRTIHAEVNAIAQAARYGTTVDGSTVYITTLPCWPCAKTLFNAGVKRIMYSEIYRPDPLVMETARQIGVELDGPAPDEEEQLPQRANVIWFPGRHVVIANGRPKPGYYDSLEAAWIAAQTPNEVLDDLLKNKSMFCGIRRLSFDDLADHQSTTKRGFTLRVFSGYPLGPSMNEVFWRLGDATELPFCGEAWTSQHSRGWNTYEAIALRGGDRAVSGMLYLNGIPVRRLWEDEVHILIEEKGGLAELVFERQSKDFGRDTS